MRSAQIAEWLLSLVGEPGRSASTIGDLMEMAGDRRTLWFWSQVAGTMFFQLGRALLTKPLRLVVLLLGGCGLSILWAAAFLAIGIGLAGAFMGGNWYRGLVVFDWTAVAALYAFPWIVGRWIARCSPGCELAASVMMAATFLAIYGMLHPALSWRMEPITRMFWVGGKIAFPAALVASGTLVRRRFLRTLA